MRACQACAFSHGGAMLAAANGQLVMIYDTWTCQLITILRCLLISLGCNGTPVHARAYCT